MFNEYGINRSVLVDYMARARHNRGMTSISTGACYTCKKKNTHTTVSYPGKNYI